MKNVIPIEDHIAMPLGMPSILEDDVPLKEMKADIFSRLDEISGMLKSTNELIQELSRNRPSGAFSAADVFKKTNPHISHSVLARKVRRIVSDIDSSATVGEPSRQNRVDDHDEEFVYTVIPVRIPKKQDFDIFADDLADALIDGLTEHEFVYLAIDLRYQ